MLPLQCDLQLSAGKHKNITHAPAAANLDAAIPLDLPRLSCKTQKNYARLRKLQLQNRISTPKRKNDDVEWSTFYKEI